MVKPMLRLVVLFGVSILGILEYRAGASAETIEYDPVSRAVIEARLGKYKGNDQQRESTLKRLFVEAGLHHQTDGRNAEKSG